MASPEQSAVFTITAYAGTNFSVPAELNPSGYDIVSIRINAEHGEGGPGNTNVIRSAIGAGDWDVISGGAGFATGIVPNGTPPLPAGNRGTVTAGGTFASQFAGTPLDITVWATLGRLTGTDQGER